MVLWPFSEDDILYPRLDKRVDQMIESGLLEEIKTLQKISSNHEDNTSTSIDYSSGIYQSIGFKEFHDYLSSPSEEAFSVGVESMKRATQKYAKYQTKWIRSKFLPLTQAAPDTHTYVLDTSDADQWGLIEENAITLTNSFLNNTPLPLPSNITPLADGLLLSSTLSKPSAALSLQKKIPCKLCSTDPSDPFLVNEAGWKEHLDTKGHQRMVKSMKNREQYMEYLRRKELGSHGSQNTGTMESNADMV